MRKRHFLALLLLFGSLFASTTPMKLRHIYLTWQNDPCTTMTLNIHALQTPSELTIYYDRSPHHSKVDQYAHKCQVKGTIKHKLPDARTIYQVELTNLEPDSVYYFTVGDKTHAFGPEQSFKTLATSAPYCFIEGGDWETTPAAAKLAKLAASYNPDAILLGGDYPSGVIGWGDYEKWDMWLDTYCRTMVTKEGHLIPSVLAIGNHEVVGGFGCPRSQVPFYFDYFKQGNTGESYFSLPLGKDTHLFVLDSGHTHKHAGQQLEWLKQELETHQSKRTKIALYHVPLYPSIRFIEKGVAYKALCRLLSFSKVENPDIRLYSYASLAGRTHWLPLFDQYEVTVAFEHHDQTLKRTKPLRSGKPHPQGTLYLGDGGWGSKLQYPPIQGYFNDHFTTLKGKRHFFWLINIESDHITYSAISSNGTLLDNSTQKIPLHVK